MSLCVLTLKPDAEWDYSRFPHPEVIADYDASGSLFKVVVVGAKAEALGAVVMGQIDEWVQVP